MLLPNLWFCETIMYVMLCTLNCGTSIVSVGPDWIEGDIDELTMVREMFELHPAPSGQKARQAKQIQGKIIIGIENPITRRLTVMAASGLKAADRNGMSDPYAIVYLNDDEVGRTTVKSRSLTPEWNESFDIAVDRQIGWATLRIELYDYDVGGESRHDFLGQLELTIGDGGEFAGPGIVMDKRLLSLAPGKDRPDEQIFGTLSIKIEDPEGIVDAEMALGRPPTPLGALEVVVLEARKLKKMDTFGKNDPYCIVSVNGERRRTSTIDGGGANPVWGDPQDPGEALHFELEQALAVEIACYDEDAGQDDLIGTALVDLDHAPEGRDWELQDWFTIFDSKEVETGEVHLLLTWTQ
eukprot:SAG31_NODE_939_length_10873_cov_5.403843_9_plen_354_part_00